MRLLLLIWALLLTPMGSASAFLLEAPEGLWSMKKQEGTVYLFVQGLELTGEADQWERELQRLEEAGRMVHFFKWSKRKKLERNVQALFNTIEQLRIENLSKEIIIVGYSAGGVLCLLALDRWIDKTQDSQIFLHTVASPLFGYSAPKFAPFAAFFVGHTALAVGRGIFKTSNPVRERTYCRHWINTDCRLDKHSCPSFGIYPMTGVADQSLLPCRGGTVVEMQESHAGILTKALLEIAP